MKAYDENLVEYIRRVELLTGKPIHQALVHPSADLDVVRASITEARRRQARERKALS